MEALIVAAEHRNHQYYVKKSLGHDPSKTFRLINCRTFHSQVGLLPRPKRASSTKGAPSPPSPKSVLPVFNPPYADIGRSSPIPVANGKGSQTRRCSVDERRGLSYSELWAGPTYSNSPPPTSVPIPKFSLRQKRTVSLSLLPTPDFAADDDVVQVAKSAPVSPTTSGENPFHSTVSATITLRRMLNLETADD